MRKLENLKDYLQNAEGFTLEELQDIEENENFFEIAGREYLVLTDEEADEKAKDYILDSLWAFNADFILQHTAVYEETTDREDNEIIKALKELQSNLCETANAIVKALIKDIDEFITDAIDADGRGHFIAGYDGEEVESGDYFIYRTN